MADFNVLGQNHIRVDSLEKVTGQATYASDVYLPDMLMCKLLTSPRSHARILSIDVSDAQKAPGVRAVITGADFPDTYFGSGAVKDRRIMARDEVFYIGEPVAAVAADDELSAAEAVKLIRVEYEDLDPVIDPLMAIKGRRRGGPSQLAGLRRVRVLLGRQQLHYAGRRPGRCGPSHPGRRLRF